MIIILDPYLFVNFSKTLYTKKVLEFISKYLDVKLAYSKELLSFLNNIYINHSEYLKDANNAFVLKKLQNLYFSNKSETDYPIAVNHNIPNNFKTTCLANWDDELNNQIDFYSRNREEIILFLSPENHEKKLKFISSIYPIEHIYEYVPSYIPFLLFNKKLAKKDSILSPSLSSPLPNKQLCEYFEKLRIKINSKSLSKKEREPYWLLLGQEVSERNGYSFEDKITSKNISIKHKRKIFGKDRIIFTSIDFEHGALEICNNKGEWVDEYGYSGDKNPCSSKKRKKNKIDHSIIL